MTEIHFRKYLFKNLRIFLCFKRSILLLLKNLIFKNIFPIKSLNLNYLMVTFHKYLNNKDLHPHPLEQYQYIQRPPTPSPHLGMVENCKSHKENLSE